MALASLIDKVKSGTEGLGNLAQGKVEEWLAEFKKATTVLETFGFTVSKLSIGMGALPEIHASLVGSIQNIREDRLQAMIDEHKGEDLLVSLLKTLIWARWGWERMEVKLTGVTLNVTLGVPPKLTTEIH
jgi:phage-related protein